MELRQLRYFRTVAELKSFSRASAHLRIAQPALSRQINKLEEELGVSLFHRDGRGAHLTRAGSAYYKHIGRVFQRLDEADRELAEFREDARPEIAIGMPPSIGPAHAARIVELLRTAGPRSDIRLVEGYSYQLADWLHAGRIDLAFLYDAKSHPNLEPVFTLREELFLVAPANANLGETIPFADLAELTLISPDLPSTTHKCLQELCEQTGVKLTFDMQIDSIATLKALVADGQGHAVLPRAAIAAELHRGSLTAARIVQPEATLDLSFVIRHRTGTKHLYDFSDHIRAFVEEALATGEWSGRLV